MNTSTGVTLTILCLFLATLAFITYKASRQGQKTPDDYFLAGRGLGTIVLLMTTGASYFSTWTLLGAIGSYYREGVWFMAFAAWAVVHGIFVWVFGARIWHLGDKYGFVTPGELVERYYRSPLLRTLFALVGALCLIPVMLIQVTGGAGSLTSLTNGDIPYWVGVLLMGVFVGAMVIIAGGRGAAWGDTFMGVFFGVVLFGIICTFLISAGGFGALRQLEDQIPELLTNKGNFPGILETALGLAFGFWIMPHMWQKFYSAKSPLVLARMSILTPLWNCWLMATGTLIIGLLAHTAGLIPGISDENSDQAIPLFFSSHAPLLGSIVVAAILAAAISSINSQLLTSANILVSDVFKRLFNRNMSEAEETKWGRITVAVLTIIVVIFAFTPAAQGYIVPLANLGYGIALQLVPAALGALVWRGGTRNGAIGSIIAGLFVLMIVYIFGSPLPFGPATSGFVVGLLTFIVVSLLDRSPQPEIQKEFHDSVANALYGPAAGK